METERILVAVAAAAVLLVVAGSMDGGDHPSVVSYDGRALLINGTRRVLFSGSIHYPRSTPDMWPQLIAKAKAGGLDVIQTYVFWNIHEPIQGQYNFQDRYDLIRFIKEIRDQGLFVSLRIGPFIEAEWKYGGFPFWLHDIPGIVYRSDNDPFKMHMQRFVSKIARMMKDEKLYASQGGPIILSQIENEYQTVEHAFHEKGTAYVNWAGKMAVSLQTGVPWIMCKQQDAPDPVINTCNGMRCGETFAGPNSPNKPSLWTENWTSFYQVYGEEPFVRSAEEIAFAVALFVAKKNGSFVNYYMYHGGTNFGNAASSYVITAYYDQAPLDEYGLVWQPKWAHLKELHEAIKANSEPLLMGKYTNLSFGPAQVAHIFQKDTGKCVAFLINEDSVRNAVVQFQNATYELPYMSISVLSDCKKVSFNTAMVSAQYGTRSTEVVEYFNQTSRWKLTMEKIPTSSYCTWVESRLIEQMAATKDSTDYLWYITRYNITSINESNRLYINSLAHAVHVFINNEYIGTVHGSHGSRDAVIFNKSISLNIGQNEISLLSVMVGLPNSGAYLERRVAGLRRVRILSSENQLKDLSNNQWVYQVGLSGENLKIFTEQGAKFADWNTVENFPLQPLLWYMTRFDAPLGNEPLALNLSSMGKGEVWINGQSIGRYWVSFKTSKGVSSQSLYHVPRCFLKSSGNLLIIFEEEMGGNPSKITLETVSVSAICAMASESYPKPIVKLQCPKGRAISSISFASYGTPVGNCASYSVGSCHSESSITVVEKACLNRTGCLIPVSPSKFGEDPCPETSKSLLIAANCHRIARYVYRNKKLPPNSDILV